MIKAKFAAVALLATTAACSCIDAPDLNMADASVNKKYSGADGVQYNRIRSAGSEDMASKAIAAMPMDRVYFGYDSAALSPAAQASLRDVAAYMKAKNISAATIEGHADERGTREYNLALGDRRAVAAKRFLESLGVKADLTTVSYGKERPAVEGSTEEAWAKNRRSVIVFK